MYIYIHIHLPEHTHTLCIHTYVYLCLGSYCRDLCAHTSCGKAERIGVHKKKLLQLIEKISKLDGKLDEVATIAEKEKKAQENRS